MQALPAKQCFIRLSHNTCHAALRTMNCMIICWSGLTHFNLVSPNSAYIVMQNYVCHKSVITFLLHVRLLRLRSQLYHTFPMMVTPHT